MRLAKVEQVLEAKLPKCNCRLVTAVAPGLEHEFAAQMMLRCPAHVHRDLGIIPFTCNPDGTRQTSSRLDALLAIYETGPKDPPECNCRLATRAMPGLEYRFAEEMELRRPTHGLRNLGAITRYSIVKLDGTMQESPVLDGLLAIYEARQREGQVHRYRGPKTRA